MDMVSIFRTITKFLDKWNIQGFIMLSLFSQIILLLLTPFRKRSRNPIIIGPIWLAYVLADWTAPYAIGLISVHQCYSPKPDDDRIDILALWAMFLLLHLGGPDNASAFSIEDNSLWRRHLTSLISQFLSTGTFFIQTLRRKKLWICTFLLFVAGSIKNSERTHALYLANLNRYRDSLIKRLPEPNIDEILSTWDEHPAVMAAFRIKEPRFPNVELVKHAYDFLEIFKSLVTGVKSEGKAHEKSQKFFLEKKPTEAFRVLEVELNFIYELFYTKVFVVYSEPGCVFRFIYWCAVVVALLIFSSIDKRGFRSIDVHITYALLFGTIGLDAIAFFMFAVSEWAVIGIDEVSEDENKTGSWRHSLCKRFLPLLEYLFSFKTTKWASTESKFCYFDWVRKLLFARWSQSLHTYNLIDYYLKERHKENCRGVGFLKDFCDGIKYVSKETVEKELWNFIFIQLKEKAKDKLKEKAKGGTGGQHSSVGPPLNTYSNLNEGERKLSSIDFGDDCHDSILILHIATDLCYEKKEDNQSLNVDPKNSKILSDYMLYLLVMKPALISVDSGIAKVRWRHTRGLAKQFFLENVPKMRSQKRERAKVREVCLRVDAANLIRQSSPEHKEIQFVLLEAFALVEKLERLCPSVRWKLISELWVELLSHVASRCKADMHIAQLSKGGELITFVWLLKSHFGLRDDFQSYKCIADIVNNMQQC